MLSPLTRGALAVVAGLAAATTSLPAAAAAPQGTILYAEHTDAVPGNYLVVLRDVPGTAHQQADDLVERYGGQVTFTYQRAVRGFAARLDEQAARRLAANPAVAHVEQDRYVQAFGTQLDPPGGLDRIDQVRLPLDGRYTFPNTGSAATVFMIDTGIRFSHAEFGGRAVPGVDTVGDGRAGADCNGHGTHLASVVGGETFGVAKEVTLVSVRVLGCQGSGTIAGVVAGVDWVTANHPARSIANVSLGGPASATLDSAVANSMASGVVYTVAAGGSNADACGFSPARVPDALTVGASTMSDQRATFSNFGPCVDLYAPGQLIPGAFHTSDTATATLSGTSPAAAHAAGAAALYWTAFPASSASGVPDALISHAVGPLPLLYIGFIPE